MRLQLNPDVKIKPAEEIMVGYLAASIVENDCWKEEVTFLAHETAKYRESVGSEINGPVVVSWYKELKEPIETEFKQKNSLKQMPGKYRSAKSVICKALKYGVELLDADGFPRGKSEVEKDLKYKAIRPDPIPLEALTDKIDLQPTDDSYVKAYWCAVELLDQWPHLSEGQKSLIKNDILKGII